MYAIEKMCKVLKVSRSGYYSWVGHKPSKREIENRELLDQIVKIHKESKQTYGSPRITAELRARHIYASRPLGSSDDEIRSVYAVKRLKSLK